MSLAAYATAVRDAIQADSFYTTNPRNANEVTVEINERAPIVSGDCAVVIYYGSETAGSINGPVQDTLYGLDITVFIRSPNKPRDQWGEFWYEDGTGLQEHQAVLKSLIHMNYTIMNSANTNIVTLEGGTPCGFLVPLQYDGAGPIREARPADYGSNPTDTVAGVKQTFRFRNAQRIEP